MTRHTLLSAALVAGFTAMASFAASAQDPAAVGSGGDPALVGGGGGYRAAPAASYGGSPAAAYGGFGNSFGNQSPAAYANETQARDKSVREVEALLQTVRGKLSGTGDTSLNDTTSANRNRYERSGSRDAARYRSDAEVLIRRNWQQLGPVTRDLYTSNFDRTDPNDPNQRYQPRYGNEGDLERRMLGGAQDAEAAMQNLEDLLLPMLQDLKRGVDTELRQRSR